MKTTFKTPEQLEFAELFEQIETFNWSQADLARELTLSKAAVSMYLSGRSNPSERSLVGMRALLSRLQGALQHGITIEKRTGEADQLNDQITYLREKDPSSYEALRTIVSTMYRASEAAADPERPSAVITHAEQERERRERKRANSAAIEPVAKSAIEAAARDYDRVHGSGAPAPKRAADAPTAQTSARSAAGEKPAREKPPATPGKAQR